MLKLKFFAQLPGDYFSHPIVSSLIFFGGLIYYIRLFYDWPFHLLPHNIHLLFCCLVYFCVKKLVLMALFCAAVRKDSVFLLGFHFLSYVQVFSYVISFVCRLKYPYNCFSFHLYFLVIVILLMLVVFVLFLVAVSSLCSFLCSLRVVLSRYRRYLPCWRVFPPVFLDTYSLSISSVGYNALRIVMGFLVLSSIRWSFSRDHFKNGPEYLTKGITYVFIPLIIFLLYTLVWSSFLVPQRN